MAHKLRVGLLGAGRVANGHIKAFLSVEDVEIAALWNRTKSRAEELADRHDLGGVRLYDSWQTMLDDGDIDIVSVVTAPQLRAEPVIAALERGIHVLVEKPFATSLEEADRMVDAATAAKSVATVSFNYRYNRANLTARRILREGHIGELRNFSSTWRFSVPSSFSRLLTNT